MRSKFWKIITITLAVFLTLGALLFAFLQWQKHEQLKNMPHWANRDIYTSAYFLCVGNDTLWFETLNNDSTFRCVSTDKTSTLSATFKELHIAPCIMDSAITREIRRRIVLQQRLHVASEELEYYASTHSVSDDGYNAVMSYKETLPAEIQENDSILSVLQRAEVKPHYYGLKYFATPHPRTDNFVCITTWRKSCNEGIYLGQVDSVFAESGEGFCRYADGSYYEGEWLNGKRHGIGFFSDGQHPIRCGVWKEDRFIGEQMVYTSERIYGIDISRYQHEVGRKRYAINWGKLRITRLSSTNRRVVGSVNYPVSFVYIKATQGIKVKSRYFLSDYKQAHKHGIRVAPYHFFSLNRDGIQQAKFFLKNCRIAKNDLPPMLDVEPSNKEIAKIGEAKLFNEMLRWLQYVEKSCGKRPVLYVSQTFINEHLAHAPEALLKYDVWIARYSEFKPFLHLLYWQLSPTGRVEGIHGDVDINVFNGNREQWNIYCLTH